jgi:RNA polymerase sigma-70 factor, ECF subfamily
VTSLDRTFREHWGAVVASLAGFLGDLDLAEEAAQEAFATAAERWPRDGEPDSPRAWLITTARNRALDRLRREKVLQRKVAMLAVPDEAPQPPPSAFPDERLELFFTCCHPALAQDAQVALTLRALGGLSTDDIARAFLVPPATMAQRLVRAKRKIRTAGIPFRVPGPEQLPERLAVVLAVVYLVFNEGYTASSGDRLVREDLAAEAIRLGRLLATLMPEEPEVMGLLALMLLIESRRAARTTPDGGIVLLPDQDRTRWDRTLIAEGQELVRRCLARNQPGPYQLQAAIQAVHSDAATADATDWGQIVALYDQLMMVAPGPVVALNRAVAVAEVEGPETALTLVDGLDLGRYHLFHAVRADLLRRSGRTAEAVAAYDEAIGLAGNAAERAHLRRVRETLAG